MTWLKFGIVKISYILYFVRCNHICIGFFNKFLHFSSLLLYKISCIVFYIIAFFSLSLSDRICTVYDRHMCASIIHYILYVTVDLYKLLDFPISLCLLFLHISRKNRTRRIQGIGAAYISCDSLHYTLPSHACMYEACMRSRAWIDL